MTLLSKLGYSPNKSPYSVEVLHDIRASNISIVIPVKDNQTGITRLIDALLANTAPEHYPLEVIIVDNNSQDPVITQDQSKFSVRVVCCKRPGPAAARNTGAAIASGEWLLFLDSDCIPTATTISGYLTGSTSYIAFAGGVSAYSENTLSRYYISQEILIPPEANDSVRIRPDYLVTANCLVYRQAFKQVAGFDETFDLAGGEDIDLAFRLLEVGELQYQFDSVVLHEFTDSLSDFIVRFYRYGIGNALVAKKYGLELTPSPFLPVVCSIPNLLLASLHFFSMQRGYVSVSQKKVRH